MRAAKVTPGEKVTALGGGGVEVAGILVGEGTGAERVLDSLLDQAGPTSVHLIIVTDQASRLAVGSRIANIIGPHQTSNTNSREVEKYYVLRLVGWLVDIVV